MSAYACICPAPAASASLFDLSILSTENHQLVVKCKVIQVKRTEIRNRYLLKLLMLNSRQLSQCRNNDLRSITDIEP